jgi:signal transduction histidine kinase/phage shock protein PspC (stress-responsive transcriptional regulator)
LFGTHACDNIDDMSDAGTETRRTTRFQLLAGRLTRTSDDRIVAGVGGGLAQAVGVRATYVRAAFVALALAGGAGIVVYALVWIATPDDEAYGEKITADHPATSRQQLGLALGFVASMIALQASGIWLGPLVWPATLLVFGAAIIWERSSDESRSRFASLANPDRPRSRIQIVLGAALMGVGSIVALTSLERFQSLGPVAVAVLLTAVGFMLVFGPWVLGLFDDLRQERRARIRSEERAEMAAHLHDSVLQTLALIQRSDDPQHMTTLARAQERDLRAWLFAPERTDTGETVGEAFAAAAAKVETAFDVPIEVVVVGDRPAGAGAAPLVAAASEAMHNAARHAGAKQVSVYVECGDEGVEAWITDQGKGFDLDAVPPDRKGISESILARMERAGGTAEIVSSPGEGTEVHLRTGAP